MRQAANRASGKKLGFRNSRIEECTSASCFNVKEKLKHDLKVYTDFVSLRAPRWVGEGGGGFSRKGRGEAKSRAILLPHARDNQHNSVSSRCSSGSLGSCFTTPNYLKGPLPLHR